MNDLNRKVAKATKWSGITEICRRLIGPVSSMVLARLLTPEAFGVVTTMAMVISFADLFTDAGFQKYLIQHEFKDEADLVQSTNVAFWSNFVMSMAFWGVIAIFSDPLAALVGSPGLGHVMIVACVTIPITAFSSIQMALYKRNLDFKTLFKVRIVGIIIPFFVTIPLAFLLRSYWALIFGTITQKVINAILLTIYSKWKPSFFYSFAKLREMLSFTIWSLIESVTIWLTHYVDVFIVGTMLSQYYLGLYKTSIVTVGHIIGLITATTTPILFSSLSRLQNDNDEFCKLFLGFQKRVGMLVIPLCVGIFCFSDFVTTILLGDQWMEASGFIGLWGLMGGFVCIFWHYNSVVFRAKGRPMLSALLQFLQILCLVPVILWAVRQGFETLYVACSLMRLNGVIISLVIVWYLIRISFWRMFRNVLPIFVASGVMFLAAYGLLLVSHSLVWQIIAILVCILVYFGTISMFPPERKLVISHLRTIKKIHK